MQLLKKIKGPERSGYKKTRLNYMKNFKLSYTRIQEISEKATKNKNGGYITNENVYNAIVKALTEERNIDIKST